MVCVQGQREGSKYGKKMQTSKINRWAVGYLQNTRGVCAAKNGRSWESTIFNINYSSFIFFPQSLQSCRIEWKVHYAVFLQSSKSYASITYLWPKSSQKCFPEVRQMCWYHVLLHTFNIFSFLHIYYDSQLYCHCWLIATNCQAAKTVIPTAAPSIVLQACSCKCMCVVTHRSTHKQNPEHCSVISVA